MAAGSGNTGGGRTVTDLSQLIRAQRPLEELVPERNQEDNLNVLEYVNSFLDIVDQELKSPKKNKEYVFGNKATFVRSAMMPRIELVASRIIEKKSLACSTLSIDDLDFFQEELELYVDLYFLLVMTLIDLTSIRKTDLFIGNPELELFLAVKANLADLSKYDELQDLNNELIARKDQYPEKPLLESQIVDLISSFPIIEGDFVFSPVRAKQDYTTGDVLVELRPDSLITSVEAGDFPSGVDLDQQTGNIFVSDASSLVPGEYDVIVKAGDEYGGVSDIHLEIPIGINEIPRYELAPRKVVQAYSVGDILARPKVNEFVPEIGRAEWIETDEYPTPQGINLNSVTGVVTVIDDDLLIVGIHAVRIEITSKNGSKSRHEFSLNFKQDRKAVYTSTPRKSISEFKTGDVLATVSDIDGAIVGVQKNSLPAGTEINSAGQLVVNDSDSLRSGTHLFNVITTDSSSVESLKTLSITMEDNNTLFSYDLSNTLPIGELSNGVKVGILTSFGSETAAKVSLISGELPSGVTLEADGDFVVSNSSILKAGNYDLRVKVFVAGLDPSTIANKQAEIDQMVANIAASEGDLQTNNDALESQLLDLSSYESSAGLETHNLLKEIEAIELALQDSNLTQDEIDALNSQLQAKQQELSQLQTDIANEIATRNNSIDALRTQIIFVQGEIDSFQAQLTGLEFELYALNFQKWREYEVPALITLEEDKPSAWHLEIPKDFDEYENTEILAQLVDCDGYSDFQIVSGTLPPGLQMDTEYGSIEVFDAGVLTAGVFILQTESTDKKGGTTDHRLALIIGGEPSSVDENYTLLPHKPANNYIIDEIIGYPYNATYAIVSARVGTGILPSGVEINPETGVLYISDNELLTAGSHHGISIKTTNSSGGSNYHPLTITFGSKTIFDVTIADPQPITSYFPGMQLVGVQVLNGSLQGIQIVGSELPPGTTMYSDAGSIQVIDPNSLAPNDYQFDLMMMGTSGATEQVTIDLTIGPAGNKETVLWNFVNPIDKDTAKVGTTVAVPSLSQSTITSAVSNTIPSGFILEQDGKVRIASAADLVVGKHTIQITLTDNNGETYVEDISLTVTGTEASTVTVTGKVEESKDFHLIKNGDLLASLNPESEVTGVTISDGAIPNGSMINGTNGRINVTNRVGIDRGIFNVSLSVQTGSGQAAGSTSKMTKASAAGSGSTQIVNLQIPVKPVPDFRVREKGELFLAGMEQRLEDFQMTYFNDPNVASIISNLFDDVVNFKDYINSILASSKRILSARAGQYDSTYHKGYQSLGADFMASLQKQSDGKVIDAIINLYNEYFVSMLALTVFRDDDISNLSSNPIAKMYELMRGHIHTMKNSADLVFVIENGQMMLENINQDTLRNLHGRFTTLVS